MNDRKIVLGDASACEEFRQFRGIFGRFGEENDTGGFPVDSVYGMKVSVNAGEQSLKGMIEISAGRMDGKIRWFPDGEELRGIEEDGVSGIHGRFLSFLGRKVHGNGLTVTEDDIRGCGAVIEENGTILYAFSPFFEGAVCETFREVIIEAFSVSGCGYGGTYDPFSFWYLR